MIFSQILSPKGDPRIILLLLFLAGLLVWILTSCGASKQVAVVDRVTHDTLYMNKIQYDSIYQYDSFLMDYHPSKEFVYLFDSVLVMKVDTMYIRDKKVEYKYKYLRDTTYIHQVDTIPIVNTIEIEKPVKYIPWYSKFLSWIGAVALGILLVYILRFVLKYFSLIPKL